MDGRKGRENTRGSEEAILHQMEMSRNPHFTGILNTPTVENTAIPIKVLNTGKTAFSRY